MFTLTLDWHAIYIALIWLLAAIGADLVLGVFVALKNKTFSWDKLGQFTVTNIPKVFVWLVMVFLGAMPKELIPEAMLNTLSTASTAVYAFLMISFLGSVLVHAKELGALSDEFWNAIGVRTGSQKG